jgi:glycosyltransferase involved in cell wall biosynthesis
MNSIYPILYFSNSALWGGVEEHICGLLRNLSRELFRAHLVCAPELYARFRLYSPEDVKITPVTLFAPGDIRGAVQLARLIWLEKFQIVHSHMFWSSLFASPVSWACRVPVIVETLHGSEAWRKGWKANYRIDRTVAHFVSKHVAVCEFDARFLSDKKHVPTSKIAVIHNGVDVSRFALPQHVRKQMRDALGFEEKDPVLIMVARFHPGKGHRVLLEAMRQLLNQYPALKLIFVGEGDGETEVRSLCEGFGLAHSVRFAGYQPDVSGWLRAADINVLPSYYEGFPLTVLEAMASGLPTVATQVGGIPEAIEDGRSGILVPPGNAQKLADALSALLRDAERRKQMGDAACARVSRHFSLKKQVQDTEKMYLSLCGSPAAHETEAALRMARPSKKRYSSCAPLS